jgi:hypothetical protein
MQTRITYKNIIIALPDKEINSFNTVSVPSMIGRDLQESIPLEAGPNLSCCPVVASRLHTRLDRSYTIR